MAASAKMSFNYYQNGKYGTLPQNPTKDMEVIYALNTKNDEHEAVVQQIKDQHEEDIQKVLKETKEKVQMLKAKLDADSQNNNKVQQLELALRQNEAIKDQQISQFEHFKRIAEERETKLKSEHAQKMLDFSHDVLKAKKDFEEKLKQFDVWKESVNEDHERKLRDLKSAHEQEIHDIRNLSKDQNNDWLNEVKKVEEKYKDEIEQLHGKYKDLEESKGVMADEYEAKLAKAQLFYEKELEAVMKMNNISQEDANKMLMEEKEKMRKDFAAQESELKKQINSVLGQLTDKEDEVESLKKDLDQLSKNLQDKAGSSSDLLKQLQAANDLASEHLAKLKAAETELSVMKERCSRQENELVKKSSTIGQLEATKLQNESSIQELEGELSKLRDKLAWLEKERHNLERQKSDLSQNQLAQLRSLEKSLEDLSIEKQAMKERYERELDGLRNNANRSQKDLLTQHEAELEKLRQKLLADLATQKLQAEEVLESTKQEMTKLRESEVSLITEDREKLRAEFDRNKEDGLGSATGMINNLRDANNQLQQQLESSRSDYKAEKTRASNLQAELEKLRLQHEAQLKEAKTEFQQKMDQVTTELDTKWQDTLRRECSKLREEINAQKESEMRAALEQLSRMKDEEISATRAGWEKKVQELMKQIASMKLSIESSSSKSQEELEKLRQESEEERRRLQAELVNAAEEYMTKVKSLEAMHEEDVKRLGEEKARELEELRQQLQSRHIEDMQAQMAAHKATVDSLRDQAEVTRRAELDKQMKELEKDKEEMKERLIEKQVTEIGRLERDHEAHLQAARMELERAVEISKQKERDHALRVEDLQGEITQRERHITNLKEDAGKLQTSISHLNKEIDFKRQEIQKIKADTDHQKRMAERLQREVENLQADHIRESQELVRQFNEAQEILKDKISELQILLNEAEDKYNNRESRPEDLELIEQLRYSIREKEEKVRALIMELVNRETNFNKVFSASPNKKKGRGKGNNSAPNLSGRLDPLPNSPIHASNLNPSRPLPPFPKKFVK
ncbi:F184A-like protein [Mya arenaria]|uniref:F184A-like protein n=1 Tax=Mya arenaria TaxID=6604 RepID=A0ABY7FIV2_MYAAR|nr:F184A-like protein [Mya arenaria]